MESSCIFVICTKYGWWVSNIMACSWRWQLTQKICPSSPLFCERSCEPKALEALLISIDRPAVALLVTFPRANTMANWLPVCSCAHLIITCFVLICHINCESDLWQTQWRAAAIPIWFVSKYYVHDYMSNKSAHATPVKHAPSFSLTDIMPIARFLSLARKIIATNSYVLKSAQNLMGLIV